MTASRLRMGVSLLALLLSAALSGACLSSNPAPSAGSAPQGPVIAPTSAAARASASATVISQAQPGFSGKTMSGVVTFAGAAPPPGSSMFLGLAKSADDQQPRTCIDAARNPVNDVGQFYAQVACTPQQGDQLLYVLIIGPEGERNWHRGVMPIPSDLTNLQVDVQ
jgi:hypothetical protein